MSKRQQQQKGINKYYKNWLIVPKYQQRVENYVKYLYGDDAEISKSLRDFTKWYWKVSKKCWLDLFLDEEKTYNYWNKIFYYAFPDGEVKKDYNETADRLESLDLYMEPDFYE